MDAWSPVSGREINFALRYHLGSRDRSLKLTIQLHLVPKIRMSEALPPFSLYVFIEYSGNCELQFEIQAHLLVVSERVELRRWPGVWQYFSSLP
jgi:hypothetical protein